MRTNAIRTACTVAACLLVVLALGAQTSGQIRGTVVDDEGNALAGVKVEARASSSARVFTTGKDGKFHFALLSPGPYKVSFTLESYSQVEKNATVRLDGTATVNAKLFRLTASGG
jgi:hypothetical protein